MADITSLFRASVKTVRTRNKALGLGKDGKTGLSIFPHPRQKTDFSQRTREVVNAISKLKEFLLKHQKDYINTASYLSADVGSMTNAERDQIDNDAQDIIRTCSDSIRLIKSDVNKQKVAEQVFGHRNTVIVLLEAYLKAVCKIYSEQRAIRVKRVVDKKRISRLKPDQHILNLHGVSKQEEGSSRILEGAANREKASKAALEEAQQESEEWDELSPEEMEAFEQENKVLLNEMNHLVDEVRQIEGKVVEITQLQEIFADKVLEQNADIDRIAETTVKTTENIKQGNEDIREAIKNNASLRVWILFFLVMCSFSLLFLDWYS